MNKEKQLQELINEYFAAMDTANAARALVVEFMKENGITRQTAERGSVSYSKGYTDKPVFDAKRFEAENAEIAAQYVKYTNRKESYSFTENKKGRGNALVS